MWKLMMFDGQTPSDGRSSYGLWLMNDDKHQMMTEMYITIYTTYGLKWQSIYLEVFLEWFPLRTITLVNTPFII
jgi:hypothetical protein